MRILRHREMRRPGPDDIVETQPLDSKALLSLLCYEGAWSHFSPEALRGFLPGFLVIHYQRNENICLVIELGLFEAQFFPYIPREVLPFPDGCDIHPCHSFCVFMAATVRTLWARTLASNRIRLVKMVAMSAFFTAISSGPSQVPGIQPGIYMTTWSLSRQSPYLIHTNSSSSSSIVQCYTYWEAAVDHFEWVNEWIDEWLN